MDNTQRHSSRLLGYFLSFLFIIQLSGLVFACDQVTASPSSASITVGQSVTITSSLWNLDKGIITYQWYNGSSPIPGATQGSYTVLGGATGTFSYYVEASYTYHHDTTTYSSNRVHITVNPAVSTSTTTSTTSSTTTCPSTSTTTESTSTTTSTPTTAPTTTSTSTTTSVVTTVGGELSVVASPSSQITLDVPQSVAVSAAASGGTGTYSYSWAVTTGTSCPNFSDPGNAASFNYNSTGSTTPDCAFTATVDDGVSTAQASTAQIIINTALTVSSVNAIPPTINPGDSAILSASASGGTGTYTYTWYEGSSCTGTALSSNTVSPTSTTTYCVLVSDGISNVTGTTAVTVNTPSGGGGGGGAGIIESGGESFTSTTTSTTTTVSAPTTSTPASSTTTSTSTTMPYISYIISSNSPVNQQDVQVLTINVVDAFPAFTYNFFVTNTITSNVISTLMVSNSLTSNSVGFMIPIEANAIGNVLITGDVTDAQGSTMLATNTFIIQSATTASAGLPLSTLIPIAAGSIIAILIGFIAALTRKRKKK